MPGKEWSDKGETPDLVSLAETIAYDVIALRQDPIRVRATCGPNETRWTTTAT